MNTEITDIKNARDWVCFDAECRFCCSLASRFAPLLHRHGFELVPLQTPWVKERLAVSGKELLSEMRLIASQGQIHGGADALNEIARQIWWAKPLYWLSGVAMVKTMLRLGYGWVARNRACLGGSCSRQAYPNRASVGALGWAASLLPTAVAISLGRALPAWVWMWTIALALFFGAKSVTILQFVRSGNRTKRVRLLAFALLWPGMDLRAFCGNKFVYRPAGREWALAAAKTLFGFAVVWVGVPSIGAAHSLITGWVGMIGFVLFVHFGIFHLQSLVWRVFGIDAHPIMRSPAAATSLSRFWGGSWNVAFRDVLHENVFKSMSGRLGPSEALFLVFAVSGILHELVISVPAYGAYGLPTAYFLLQGLGIRLERSKAGRKLGLGSGVKGWCFVALVAGGPAYWLFHPILIYRVILPMLDAIGAT